MDLKELLTFKCYLFAMGCSLAVKQSSANATLAKRRMAEAQGRVAEGFVAEHWKSQGFTILAQRLRTQAGEIDLVAADSSTLVFVEVKSRKSFAQAAHSIMPRQQARLFHAANAVLADHEDWHRPNMRFDIALVSGGVVQHIQDAIRAY